MRVLAADDLRWISGGEPGHSGNNIGDTYSDGTSNWYWDGNDWIEEIIVTAPEEDDWWPPEPEYPEWPEYDLIWYDSDEYTPELLYTQNPFHPSSVETGELWYGGRDVQQLTPIFGTPNNNELVIYRDTRAGHENDIYIDRNGNGRIDGSAIINELNNQIYGRALPFGGFDIHLGVHANQLSQPIPIRGPLGI